MLISATHSDPFWLHIHTWQNKNIVRPTTRSQSYLVTLLTCSTMIVVLESRASRHQEQRSLLVDECCLSTVRTATTVRLDVLFTWLTNPTDWGIAAYPTHWLYE